MCVYVCVCVCVWIWECWLNSIFIDYPKSLPHAFGTTGTTWWTVAVPVAFFYFLWPWLSSHHQRSPDPCSDCCLISSLPLLEEEEEKTGGRGTEGEEEEEGEEKEAVNFQSVFAGSPTFSPSWWNSLLELFYWNLPNLWSYIHDFLWPFKPVSYPLCTIMFPSEARKWVTSVALGGKWVKLSMKWIH